MLLNSVKMNPRWIMISVQSAYNILETEINKLTIKIEQKHRDSKPVKIALSNNKFAGNDNNITMTYHKQQTRREFRVLYFRVDWYSLKCQHTPMRKGPLDIPCKVRECLSSDDQGPLIGKGCHTGYNWPRMETQSCGMVSTICVASLSRTLMKYVYHIL